MWHDFDNDISYFHAQLPGVWETLDTRYGRFTSGWADTANTDLLLWDVSPSTGKCGYWAGGVRDSAVYAGLKEEEAVAQVAYVQTQKAKNKAAHQDKAELQTQIIQWHRTLYVANNPPPLHRLDTVAPHPVCNQQPPISTVIG
jgi:hypothetical protein